VQCRLFHLVENISRVCFVVLSLCFQVDLLVEFQCAATQARLSEFLRNLCKTGLALQPKGDHLVAATIPEDQLRAEERHPR
jgi:hypothetical protein